MTNLEEWAQSLADSLASTVTTIVHGDSFEMDQERASEMILAFAQRVHDEALREAAKIAENTYDRMFPAPRNVVVARNVGHIAARNIRALIAAPDSAPPSAPPAAFQSEALKGASAEASREQAPFLEAVVALRSSAPPADVTRALADAVDFYEREFYPLSNFSAFQINWKAYLFPTAEHAYQWEKFAVYDPERATVILRAKSAHDAFKKAEEWRNYRKPNWDQIKVQTMLEIIRAKTEQHEYVRRKLLETGNRPLIECSWRDDFWGWGPNRDGQNMLGKLWMKIRSEIRAALAAADPQTNPEIPYNPAWTHGEIGADEQALMEANGWRMRQDGSYFKPGS